MISYRSSCPIVEDTRYPRVDSQVHWILSSCYEIKIALSTQQYECILNRGLPQIINLSRRVLLSGTKASGVCPDYHKISHTYATYQQESPLPCRWILRSEKRSRQKCARCRQRAASRASQIADEATAQVSTGGCDNFHSAAVRVGTVIVGSILTGLLKSYPGAGTSRATGGPHRGTSPRRIEDFTETDAAFAGISAHEDTCYPAFYNVPSLRRTSCTMHKKKPPVECH